MTAYQKQTLKKCFLAKAYMEKDERQQLCISLNVSEKRIMKWYEKQRHLNKKKGLHVELGEDVDQDTCTFISDNIIQTSVYWSHLQEINYSFLCPQMQTDRHTHTHTHTQTFLLVCVRSAWMVQATDGMSSLMLLSCLAFLCRIIRTSWGLASDTCIQLLTVNVMHPYHTVQLCCVSAWRLLLSPWTSSLWCQQLYARTIRWWPLYARPFCWWLQSKSGNLTVDSHSRGWRNVTGQMSSYKLSQLIWRMWDKHRTPLGIG